MINVTVPQDGSETTCDAKMIIECESCYKLSSGTQTELTCLATGWSPSPNTLCTPITSISCINILSKPSFESQFILAPCPTYTASPPLNGVVSYTSGISGERTCGGKANLQCKDCFKNPSNPVLSSTCQGDQTWSPTLTPCERKPGTICIFLSEHVLTLAFFRHLYR